MDKKVFLFLLFCLSLCLIPMHAATKVELDGDEVRIYYKNDTCLKEGLSLGASAYGWLRGSVWYTNTEWVEGNLAMRSYKIGGAGLLAASSLGAVASVVSLIKNVKSEKELVLTLSPDGISYNKSALIAWNSVRKVKAIRYKSFLKNSFEFEIVTNDNLRVVIDSQRVDVDFNWLYSQIHVFYRECIEVKIEVDQDHVLRSDQ